MRFRDSAQHTAPFGLDDTFGELRIHNANDRGTFGRRGRTFGVWLPFDCDAPVWHEHYGGGFGSLLVLPIRFADFEIRIAHMHGEELSEELRDALDRERGLVAGAYLGRAGNKGVSVGEAGGEHTHTEIVSMSETSQVCDRIMEFRGIASEHDFFDADVNLWAVNRRLSQEKALAKYEDERERRRVEFVNSFQCRRADYYDGYRSIRTWYNSRSLFNGV